MSNDQLFGSASKLEPSLTANGLVCSLVVQFLPSAESDRPGHDVVSGNIVSVDDLGGGVFKLVCARDSVPFSYTKVIPGEGGTEVVYYCLCGGNICNTPEPLRFYNWLAESSLRGDMAATRAEERDMCWLGPPGAERGYFIQEAAPFNAPLEEVNYNDGESRPTISYAVLDFTRISIPDPDRTTNPGAVVDLTRTLAPSGFFAGTGLRIEQSTSPGTYTELSRKTFTPDPAENYPADASLAEGEYWINEATRRIILASLNENIGTHLQLSWWEQGFLQFTGDAARFCIVTGTGGGGYDDGGAADEVNGVVMSRVQDFETTIFLIEGGAEAYGTGSIVVEFPTVGLMAAMLFGSGGVLDVVARTTVGGGVTSQSHVPVVFAPTAQAITIEKNGSDITFRAGMTDIATVDLGSTVREKIFSKVGVNTWGASRCMFAELAGEVHHREGAFGGGDVRRVGMDVHRLNFQDVNGLIYKREVSLPSATSVVEVKSIKRAGSDEETGDFGVYSASGSPRRRNHYEVVSATMLRFYCETPDVVRIEQASAGVVTTPPGRAPRITTGIVNFATIDPSSGAASLATTDVNENVANWHDALIVRSADGSLPFAAGDPFTVRRNAVLDPRESWALEYSIRNDAGAETWAAVPAESFVGRPAEGVFLIGASWLSSLSAAPCFRLRGKFVTHHANLDARTVNDFDKAVDQLSGLFSGATTGGSGVGIVAGRMEGARLTATDFACHGCDIQRQGLMWGVWRERWEELANDLAHGGLSLPQPYPIPSVIDESSTGAEGFTTAANVTTNCAAPCSTNFESRKFGTETRLITTYPWGGDWLYAEFPKNCFGTDWPTFRGVDDQFDRTSESKFRFAGIPFAIPAQLRRAPTGTQIVEAWLEVKFTGLVHRAWNLSVDNRYMRIDRIPAMDANEFQHSISYHNGVLKGEYIGSGITGGAPYSYIEEDDLSVTTASLSYNLVGRRRSSKNVYCPLWVAENSRDFGEVDDETYQGWVDYATMTVQNGAWVALGAGVATGGTVATGKWGVVNVTAALQGLLNARHLPLVDFQLWPTNAGVDLNATPGGLSGYLRGLDTVRSLAVDNIDDETFHYEFEISGQYTEFDSMETGALFFRMKLPDGTLSTHKVPHLNRGKMIKSA